MIMLQRKLLILIRESKVGAGKAPQGMKAGVFYPVVGYSIQKIKREKTGEHEDLTGFYFIDQAGYLSFVYSSYCEVSLDPLSESVANTETVKGGKDVEAK